MFVFGGKRDQMINSMTLITTANSTITATTTTKRTKLMRLTARATKAAEAVAAALQQAAHTTPPTPTPSLQPPPKLLLRTLNTAIDRVLTREDRSEVQSNWRKNVSMASHQPQQHHHQHISAVIQPATNYRIYKKNTQNKSCLHNNNFLSPAFLCSRQLVYVLFLLLVCIVNDCYGGGVGSSESLPFTGVLAGATPEERPLQRRHATTKENNATDDTTNLVFVNKCCEKFEIHIDGVCTQVNESDYFQPMFTNYQGVHNVDVKFKFVIGIPACGTMQTWPIYHYQGSADQLVLLDDGKLRHYTNTNEDEEDLELTDYDADLDDERKSLFHDYAQGHYCLDKAVSSTGQHRQILYANICLAKKEIKWSDSTFLLRKIINPIFHIMSLIMLLLISIIYFILPTLRDLVGNIITTIAVCLMATQAADLVRIFTEFTNHVSFIIADIVLYVSLLGAFFWLNSYGYYIWKTFRSRNVFLRVTDGRKYCYYSAYAWGCTAFMASLAVFAHFFLDAESYRQQNLIGDQETIGWLGMWIFFAPIACTIIINIFFYVTTLKLINRRNVYGRIQHKLRANFIMFSWMLLIMSFAWLFFVLSWLPYDGLLYVHILVNALQAPLLLYVCVLRQKHVIFLLKKSCCYNEPPSANDWGDELHYMNCNDY
ncbi:probable G-protein coupled receptor Mth-like 5 isoform X2 [Eurosta solidaginis]|uniref:probable G-protein coupled receptor Mth-like 5 isoform X2 n=1 Tax=Eurosta solidaginis TaxID=178769 RepID=UPI003530C33C